ncbi:hypothetical protein TNCV_908561 [Trichonephila clavipes]|nr:hypothetical protein TNCV_908561 [Trichonephila clavipes]
MLMITEGTLAQIHTEIAWVGKKKILNSEEKNHGYMKIDDIQQQHTVSLKTCPPDRFLFEDIYNNSTS